MSLVSIAWESVDPQPWMASLESFAHRALAEMGYGDWELSIVLSSDEFIQKLNARYRNRDEPTDVLSFELGVRMDEGEGARFVAGDIVISLPALDRNVQDFSVSWSDEFKRLIVHGILHLAGNDHEDNDPSRPMLVEQESILEKLHEARIG